MKIKHIIYIAAICFSEFAFSHGGGLTSEGCHNERKTGGYHCHRSKAVATMPHTTKGASYKRVDFNYRSYKPKTSIGFYTNKSCDIINIDHVVSLKDAYDSGAYLWDGPKKEAFANDRFNHVPSCSRINSSKGSEGPTDFLRRSTDGRGLDYEIVRFCEYVKKYYQVKKKYGLSFDGNNTSQLKNCGV
jgi:5-methylcytosine-specific restriction endonuclease McrA